MSEQQQAAAAARGQSAGQGFVWHPTYAGKSFERVRGDLVEEIGRDQRSYKLAMDGADQAEHESLSAIVDLERRWSDYEFDWAETDPEHLADRILTFEKECERRQEPLSFADYRASGALVQSATPVAEATPRPIPVLKIGLALLAVLLIILVIAIFF